MPTRPARATGAADAMDVARALGGRVEVDDVRHVGEVESTCGDVRRDERRRWPDSKRLSARSRCPWFRSPWSATASI